MSDREIMRGPEMPEDDKTRKESSPEIKGITGNDIRVVLPNIGETTFVLQRNAKDERNPESPNFGALTPEAADKTHRDAKVYFEHLLKNVAPEERKKVEILIVSSDASLVAPEGPAFNSPHKRGLETAAEVMKGAQEAMKELGMPENQLLNLSEYAKHSEPEGPITFTGLEALRMFDKSPKFVEYLKSTYGAGKKFWVAYESEQEKEKRKELGAEGVNEIATRVQNIVRRLSTWGTKHAQADNKRLIIWAVSHYDALSPFIKAHVLGRPATDYLPIDAGGGITLEIDKHGATTTELGNQRFTVTL